MAKSAGGIASWIASTRSRIGELPAGEVWVHCATGYRASIAASLLDGHGRSVVLIDDEFENAEGLTR